MPMQFIINFTVPARRQAKATPTHRQAYAIENGFPGERGLAYCRFDLPSTLPSPHCFGQPWCSWQDSILMHFFSAEFPSQHRPADRHHSLNLIILSSSTMIPERKGWSFVFTHVLHQYP